MLQTEEAVIQLERPNYHRLADYFGAWAMEEASFEGLRDLIMRTDLAEHIRASQAAKGPEIEPTAGPAMKQTSASCVAVIQLRGTLMKAESSFGSSSSTVEARSQIRKAVNDPSVAAILFLIDSPGGTVAGTHDLAAEIAAAQEVKPTAAHIEDCGASAAYWAASQTGFISTNPTGMVGSIGTVMAVRDTSAMAEKNGLKVHLIKTGLHKGAGTPGTQVTDEHLAEFQRLMDDVNAQFVEGALVRGRGMTPERAKEVADGRVHIGQVAVDMGLVDAVQTVEQTVALLMERAAAVNKAPGAKQEATEMDTNVDKPAPQEKAATLQELKGALPKASSDFLLGQLERGATLAQAKDQYLSFLEAKAEADEKAHQQELEEAKAAAKKPGAEPFKEGGAGGADAKTFDDPKAEFMRLRTEYMAKHPNVGAVQAGAAVAAKNKELHQAYLAATNS